MENSRLASAAGEILPPPPPCAHTQMKMGHLTFNYETWSCAKEVTQKVKTLDY